MGSRIVPCLVDSSDDDETQTRELRNSTEVSHADAAKAELDAFLHLVDGNNKMDTLEFWRQQNNKFPLMTLVAFSVLGAVGTLAAAEGAFFDGGQYHDAEPVCPLVAAPGDALSYPGKRASAPDAPRQGPRPVGVE